MNNSITLEFLRKHGKCINTIGSFCIFPPIICKDDCFISVQAGTGYNSYPKEDIESMEYEELELRCSDLSTRERETLKQFNCTHDKDLFYNVPIKFIDILIERHGGLDVTKADKIIRENHGDKND